MSNNKHEHEKQSGPERDQHKSAEELKDLINKSEVDKSAKISDVDKEKSVEKAREELKDELERESSHKSDKEKSKSEKGNESDANRPISRREKNQIYSHTMKSIRHQLSPAERSFSKLIHAKPVEKVSEVLEESIFSNSFVWGGVVGAVLLGGIIYLAALNIGFQLSGSEFTIGLIVGGIIGLVVERILRIFKKTKS